MANFDSVRIQDDQWTEAVADTIPDSYSITEEQSRRFLNRQQPPQQEVDPSDWRLEYRAFGKRPGRHWACPFLYLPFLYAYAFLGAWLFTLFEKTDADNSITPSPAVVLNNTITTTESDICYEHYSQQLNDLVLDGIPYSISVFTTVGYGIKSPKTTAGQLTTIFYAMFGIPLYFAFSADFQDWLDRAIFVWLRRLIFRKNYSQRIERWKKFLVMLVLAISYLFIQSWISMMVEGSSKCGEKWTYITSVYFVFQSIALIGFGDLITSQNLYLTVHLPMLIVGQVLLTGLFTAIIKYIRFKFPKWALMLWHMLRTCIFGRQTLSPSKHEKSPLAKKKDGGKVDRVLLDENKKKQQRLFKRDVKVVARKKDDAKVAAVKKVDAKVVAI